MQRWRRRSNAGLAVAISLAPAWRRARLSGWRGAWHLHDVPEAAADRRSNGDGSRAEAADRQPGRDRRPHRAHRRRDGHRHRRGLFRGRRGLAAHPQGRRGAWR